MNIKEVHKSLISASIDWSHFLTNSNYIRSATANGPCITWPNYQSGVLHHPILASRVAQLRTEQQYIFLVKDDNSVIQMYYQYDEKGNDLESASLAFYSAKPLHIMQKNQKAKEDAPVSWLRVDYAPKADQGVLHHACHMHLSSFLKTRVVVGTVPTPAQFLELVVAWHYPEIYQKHRLTADGQYKNLAKIADLNSDCFPAIDCAFLQQVAHIRIPTPER